MFTVGAFLVSEIRSPQRTSSTHAARVSEGLAVQSELNIS